MNKELYITDEGWQELEGTAGIDLLDVGYFDVDEGFFNPNTNQFRLVGIWTQWSGENNEIKTEVKAEIEGVLNPDDIEWYGPIETVEDVKKCEWVNWDIQEA
jgi:hypothetical protein